MCHFLSHGDKNSFAYARPAAVKSRFRQAQELLAPSTRGRWVIGLVIGITMLTSAFAQQPSPSPFWTNHGNNARDGSNINEPFLTPANVNQNSFGKLFSFPVDYVVMAQPLYVPNVNIPGQGLHNVVYVVTQADSVYAIDADNGEQLWHASMLDGGTTATTASGTLPCGASFGYNQEGIIGTPVIDTATNTMYLVAKTVFNGVVRHTLHALDITTGLDLVPPVVITATSTSTGTVNHGKVTQFNSLHQKNRPGLLLLNNTIYMGFGSNGCNDKASGWLLAYDEGSLSQIASFNTAPDNGLASIWQAGTGIAADEAGNVFVETAESCSHCYNIPTGGQTYGNSVLKLDPGNLTIADYFTPSDVAYLNQYDLDLSSAGALILPDQDGPYPHELIASGKQGFVYVLNRDLMGAYEVNDSGVIQETTLIPGETSTTVTDAEFGGPAYWNNTVYFTPTNSPVMAFPLSGGLLGTPATTAAKYNGGHSPSISANGTTAGVLWDVTGSLLAFDAVSLQLLYNSNLVANKRDTLSAVGHFVTPTVANGKVYVGTTSSVVAYGLFQVLNVTGGNGQTATVGTALAAPIQVQAVNPYTRQPDVGATVTFSDGGKGGVFNPASAVSDSNGNVSTTYTVSKTAGTYTLTISGVGFVNGTVSATAKVGPPFQIIYIQGQKQTAAAGSYLASPVVAKVVDLYKNGVTGVTVYFSASNGGAIGSSSAVTGANGLASTTLKLPTTVGTVKVITASSGIPSASIPEYSVAGPPATINITGGNNQSALAGTQLPQPLSVFVSDQYGNPVSGSSVTFSDGGAGGSFSNINPVISATSGTAMQSYTLPTSAGKITVQATANGLANSVVFTETAQ